MSDMVIIENLKADAVIGIYDWEKKVRQPLLLTLEMAWDNRKPAQSDDIQDALDYESVSNELLALVERQPYELIERVAEEAAAMVMQRFAVPWVRLKVAKPTAVKQAASVAVQIERGQRG